MKKYLTLLSLLAIGTVAANAQLTEFDYSYTFGADGTVASGTLEGILSGNNVTDVQDVTLSIATPGSAAVDLTINTIISATGSGSALVSFIADNNNFSFTDGIGDGLVIIPTGGIGPFGVSGPSAIYSTANINGNVNLDAPTFTANWSLAAVPEPSTYVAGALMLLPLGVSALRMLRKTRTA